MLFSFIRFLCACAVLCCTQVLAKDAVVQKAYFEDPSNQLTLQEVQRQTFVPYASVLTRGFTPSAIWVRLLVQGSVADPSAVLPDHHVVRVQPHYLDEVALYDPAMGHHAPRYAGDRHVREPGGYVSLNHNFLIERSPQDREIWLRFKTNSSSSMEVQVLPLEEALDADRQQDVVMGFFVASFAMFLIWVLIYWWHNREPLAAVLMISLASFFLNATSLWGYWRLWFGNELTPIEIDNLTCLFVLFGINSFLWLHTRFLKEFNPSPWAMALLRCLLMAFPTELLMFALGQFRWGLQLNIQVALIGAPVLLLTACTAKSWQFVTLGKPAPIFSKPVLVTFYFSLNFFLWWVLTPLSGLPHRSEFGVASGPVFGFFNAMVMIATLQLRARRMQQANAEMQTSLQLAEQEVTQERQQREAQNRFMGMLTHELKTPLGVLLMAISSSAPSVAMQERAKRAIKDMNAVLERCVLVDKLEEGNLSQTKERFDVVKELEQVMLSFDSPRLHLTPCAHTMLVEADRQLVSVVLKNLIENALKYSAKDSAVLLLVQHKTWAGSEGLCVRVSNLPGDAGWPDAERLFSKYYRSAGSHRSTGSGLGLHLSKQIALHLGGDVHYVSDDDYVRFEFCLPV